MFEEELSYNVSLSRDYEYEIRIIFPRVTIIWFSLRYHNFIIRTEIFTLIKEASTKTSLSLDR